MEQYEQNPEVIPEQPVRIQCCVGVGCTAKGIRRVIHQLRETLDIPYGSDLSRDGRYLLEETGCQFTCLFGPVVFINGKPVFYATADTVLKQAAEAGAKTGSAAAESDTL